MPDQTPHHTNRLATESSPYLRQHARNPVDWYPWGSEAFAKARAEDKPVFLSIGYSTCHWCHVMEHESFDDLEVAEVLNREFVSIKLDREQRPDLDDIYMTGVQMISGQGGWPMSNFLTPDGKPFFAGTYFPKVNFLALLGQISAAWRDRREDVLQQAENISNGIARFTAARADAKEIPDDMLSRASEELLGRTDELNGGFGGSPKFPNESSMLLLLEDWQRHDNPRAGEALTLTLNKMREGGIYDQICGGFHRYTVDAVWLVPHFEKMLYNQAQLVRVYARAASLTGNADWRRVVEQTLDYVLRDMRNEKGAFYSATDADSEGEEGLFFLWTPDELDAVLEKDDAALVKTLYGVSKGGNFEGRNILHLGQSLAASAESFRITEEDLWSRLQGIHRRLYEAREGRVHPLRDDKIITAWNGMMITAFATAGHELGRPDYLDAAVTAAERLWDTAWDGNGRLWRISFEGNNSIPANLEDYACFAEAVLTLYRFGAGDTWLVRGRQLVEAMLADFQDEANGGFYLSREETEGPLITRPKSPMDGATPSANSVAVASLVLLYETSGDAEVQQAIERAQAAFAGLLVASPSAFAYMLVAMDHYRHGRRDSVQFAADGNIRVSCEPTPEGYQIDIAMAPGWHINADRVSDGDLVATRVEAGDATVEFGGAANEIFEGNTRISIKGKIAAVDLVLQACSGDRCFAPETLRFNPRRPMLSP